MTAVIADAGAPGIGEPRVRSAARRSSWRGLIVQPIAILWLSLAPIPSSRSPDPRDREHRAGRPAIGLVVLLAIFITSGYWASIPALVPYAAIPVLRNSLIGVRGVDDRLVEAGRGVGMSAGAVRLRIANCPLLFR